MPTLKSRRTRPSRANSSTSASRSASDRGIGSYRKLEYRPPSSLRPDPRNARTHNRQQRRKLKALIEKVGFIDPIIVDASGMILSGHLRHQVAQELNYSEVPVIQIEHLSDAEKRVYALAANRMALDAGWDRGLLAAELGELISVLEDSPLELCDTGFEVAEIDAIALDHGEGIGESDQDIVPNIQRPVSRLGDLWTLKDHRLLVGDARRTDDVTRLMGGAVGAVMITDPPYNVSITHHARRSSAHREFAMASGEMSDGQFKTFLQTTLSLAASHLADGAIAYVFIDWRHMALLETAMRDIFDELKNVCVWVKSNAGLGSFYRSQHEFVLVFKRGNGAHINSFGLGQHGRSRTNVWKYAGVNSFKTSRRAELDDHPTSKPVAMIADALLDCSRRGDVVIDTFAGSGTILVAAEKVGRRAYAMEIDPVYADVAIRRWQAFTGRDATLAATGETFHEVQTQREADADIASSDTPERPRRRRKATR